ncbi:MAG: zf-HC2 domain-containing protein [Acidobacteria bacterium]|nr:zf-HC2 domain-containing protein [Acidobacteriota bacterium]
MTHQQAVQKQAAERYLLEEMPELERYAFEAHFFECDECADSVRTGALMKDGVHDGLLPVARTPAPAPEVSPLPAPAASSPLRTWLPWAVAAMLTAGIGYQTLWMLPDLRSQVLRTQALAPITLGSATRGVEPTITRPADGVVAFAIDVAGVPAGARLTYDLRTAGGRSVASGTAVAPSPGTPLLLLMPGASVGAAGGYTLSVHAEGDPESLPVDYRFTVTER